MANECIPADRIFRAERQLQLGKIPTKVSLDGLKRNMSRGISLSNELDLRSALGDIRAYLYSPVLG